MGPPHEKNSWGHVAGHVASGGEFEDLHHVVRSLDRPRVVQDRTVVHRLLGDLAEAVATDADLGQAARQAESVNGYTNRTHIFIHMYYIHI